jgi:hypothetical protein
MAQTPAFVAANIVVGWPFPLKPYIAKRTSSRAEVFLRRLCLTLRTSHEDKREHRSSDD